MAHDKHKHEPKVTPVEHEATDAWHDHSHDTMPMHAHAENVAVGRVMAIGIALFVAVVISVVAVYGLYKWFVTHRLAAQEVTTPNAPALQWRSEKAAQLAAIDAGGNRVIAGGEGVPDRSVTVRPIGDAMKTVVEQYRQAGPRAAGDQKPAGTAQN
jgi:hypothetical protein